MDDEAIRAASLHELSSLVFDRLDYFMDIRGIHEIAARKDMKRVLFKYLEFYNKSSGSPLA